MDESQFPDAPQTPAPIFAYRALKGFFLGSPDEDVGNKENAQSSTRQNPATLTAIPPNTTPQKRKREFEYLSPVKSILRASGVNTPRALHLRKENIAVAFKDVRKSVSSEAKRHQPAQVLFVKQPVSQLGEVASCKVAEIEKPEKSIATTEFKRTQSYNLTTERADDVNESTQPPPQRSLFDIEAYKRSTEKEMKKLVRHGQKMREYARKQDEENAKLRQTLEQLKKENRRLSTAWKGNTNEEQLRRKVSGPVVDNSRVQHGDIMPQIYTSNHALNKEKSRATAIGSTLHDIPAVVDKTVRDASIRSQQSPIKEPRSGVIQPQSSRVPLELPQNGHSPRSISIRQHERPSSMRLAPDRMAAARERVRLKAEKRKVSEMDKSEVDWAGL